MLKIGGWIFMKMKLNGEKIMKNIIREVKNLGINHVEDGYSQTIFFYEPKISNKLLNRKKDEVKNV